MVLEKYLSNLRFWLHGLRMLVSPSYRYVILFVTARCNARCHTCFYWQRIEDAAQHAELSLEEYQRIAQSMRGILYLSIGGGEPFLRPDLAAIVQAFYTHSGVRFVNISTNGLLRDAVVKQVGALLSANPRLRVKLTLSLDGVGERHDQIRGVPGNWAKCLAVYEALRAIRDENPRLTLEVGSTLCAFNQDHVIALIDYVADEMAVDDHTFTFVRGDAKDPQALEASIQAYDEAMTYLKQRRKRGASGVAGLFAAVAKVMYDINTHILHQDQMVVPCVAAKQLITIDERGAVRPCEILWAKEGETHDVGDLRQMNYDLRAIRQGASSRREQRWIRDTQCHCTFECANLCNVVFRPRLYPRVLRYWWKR